MMGLGELLSALRGRMTDAAREREERAAEPVVVTPEVAFYGALYDELGERGHDAGVAVDFEWVPEYRGPRTLRTANVTVRIWSMPWGEFSTAVDPGAIRFAFDDPWVMGELVGRLVAAYEGWAGRQRAAFGGALDDV